jgi:hypothetical protein
MSSALGFVGFYDERYLAKVDKNVKNILHQMH